MYEEDVDCPVPSGKGGEGLTRLRTVLPDQTCDKSVSCVPPDVSSKVPRVRRNADVPRPQDTFPDQILRRAISESSSDLPSHRH